MRYFIELAYNGTRYNGWQRQPDSPSVQQTIEEGLELLLRVPCPIMGCGRTDTGVHAAHYIAHFEYESELGIPENLTFKINRVLPPDIVIRRIVPVHEKAHARFGAVSRSYRYYIAKEKSPFKQDTCYDCFFFDKIDVAKMQEAADLLLHYQDFTTFCKTGSQENTKVCIITHAQWEQTEQGLEFYISANRFLRGMVRLIVGECLNIGLGKTTVAQMRNALETNTRLHKALTVPARGLFLTDIKYPFDF